MPAGVGHGGAKSRGSAATQRQNATADNDGGDHTDRCECADAQAAAIKVRRTMCRQNQGGAIMTIVLSTLIDMYITRQNIAKPKYIQ